jgi:hypothetical protein
MVLFPMVSVVCALRNRPGTISTNSPVVVNRTLSLQRTRRNPVTRPKNGHWRRTPRHSNTYPNSVKTWPTVISTSEPEYTERAKNAGLEGFAVVEITIDESGMPQDPIFIQFQRGAEQIPDPLGLDGAKITVEENGMSQDPTFIQFHSGAEQIPDPLGLDEAAIAALKFWRFRPATKEGKPISIRATVSVQFRLPQ